MRLKGIIRGILNRLGNSDLNNSEKIGFFSLSTNIFIRKIFVIKRGFKNSADQSASDSLNPYFF